MPKTAPVKQSLFNESYAALGRYLGDCYSLPHYNSSATLAFFPGEPFPKTRGSGAVACLAQSLIMPGEYKTVLAEFKAAFPCDFSANIKDGDEVYWDEDNELVSLAADVTNGFSLGYATYEVEPGQAVTAVADDRPIVADANSTEVVVYSPNIATTLKGTSAAFGATASKATKSTKTS